MKPLDKALLKVFTQSHVDPASAELGFKDGSSTPGLFTSVEDAGPIPIRQSPQELYVQTVGRLLPPPHTPSATATTNDTTESDDDVASTATDDPLQEAIAECPSELSGETEAEDDPAEETTAAPAVYFESMSLYAMGDESVWSTKAYARASVLVSLLPEAGDGCEDTSASSVSDEPAEKAGQTKAESPVSATETSGCDHQTAPPSSPQPCTEPASESCQTEPSSLRVVPTSEKRPADVEADSPVTFGKPAWEVDAFQLSEIAERIMEGLGQDMTQVVEQIRQYLRQGRRLIGIRSCVRKEGRTTVAIALAHVMAQYGVRTFLLDADLGRPDLIRQLGVVCHNGWNELLQDDRDSVSECAISLADSPLVVLPLSTREPQLSWPTGRRIKALLEQLIDQFDLVLVDCGPGSHVGNGWYGDLRPANLLVRDLRRSSTPDVQQLCRQLEGQDQTVLGVIENFAHSHDESARRIA